MKFQNQYGYEEETDLAWLWVLLFGCFYFAYKGVWAHFVIGFFVACITCGVSWIFYPIFANQIMENFYMKNGWKRM